MLDALGPLLWAAVAAYWAWLRPRLWSGRRRLAILVSVVEVGLSLGLLYLGAVVAVGMIQRR
jgi:hypothetical protein